MFADLRVSTNLAESRRISDFTSPIQRFSKGATEIILGNFGMVKRLTGDQVIGLFVPRFSGWKNGQAAIETAIALLHATQHQVEDGPWAPVGIGIYSGPAYVGTFGSGESVNEIAVPGNDANLAACLSFEAAPGEVIIRQETLVHPGSDSQGMEMHILN